VIPSKPQPESTVNHRIEIAPKTLWALVGFVCLIAFSWLILTHASTEVIIVYLAIVIGEGIRPAVQWLERRHIYRWLSILIVIGVIAAVILGLLWLVVTPLIAQIASLVDHAPEYVSKLQQLTIHYEQMLPNNKAARTLVDSLPQRILILAEGQVSLLFAVPMLLARFVFNVLFVVLLTIFWLLAAGELARFVLSFAHDAYRDHVRSILDELSVKTGGYVRGVLINMVAIGVVSGIGDFFLGVPYALLLGVVAGLTEAIPVVGPFIGGFAGVAVAFVTLDWHHALYVLIMYVVIQQFEGNTLVPLVMNRVVNLTPFTIVVALIIGTALAGISGALLSLPTAAVIKVLIVRIGAPAMRAITRAEPAA